MRKENRLHLIIYMAASTMLSSLLFTGCSSTSALKEDEQLFAGLKPIEYTNYEENSYADSVKEEMEYALASAPTGAFMGSSYFRTPFPVRLWIWNAFSPSDDGLSRWITKVFGSKPKLMENVNPQLRAQVAEHQLDKYGYFNGKVDYEVQTQSNPKEAKVAYKVDMGHLWRLFRGLSQFPGAWQATHRFHHVAGGYQKRKSFQCLETGAGAPATDPTFP